MKLARFHVDEGFLDGLDVEFLPGLNVLIGPRGTGKTSVIELIRFGFGIDPLTDAAGDAAREHVQAVLGSGRVTLEVDVPGGTVLVSRSLDEAEPRVSGQLDDSPLVLAQNEIESIAIDARGRLRLIDGLTSDDPAKGHGESALEARIASVSKDIATVSRSTLETQNRLEALRTIPAQLREAEEQQKALGKTAEVVRRSHKRLSVLDAEAAILAVEVEHLERVGTAARDYVAILQETANKLPRLPSWPSPSDVPPELQALEAFLDTASPSIGRLKAGLSSRAEAVETARQNRQERRMVIEDESRSLRQTSEKATAGAGAAARKVTQLRRQAAERGALEKLVQDQDSERAYLRTQRDDLLDQLDALRATRFSRRRRIADGLNQSLRPNIEVQVDRYGLRTSYAAAITAKLRGSQLHSAELSRSLSTAFSPRELVAAIESDDVQSIVSRTSVSAERARRLLSYLREQPFDELLTAQLDDSVVLRLLDGGEMKPTQHLSTGQRCTVVLPILLAHQDRILIVDQPEDHLDNAFVAETVVPALVDRKRAGQLIFATHNANIPVLGNAAQVICLGSDGRRGFKRIAGGLEDDDVVDAICAVMEGGRQAFEQRATFYSRHDS